MEISRPEFIAGRKAELIRGACTPDALGVHLKSLRSKHPAPLYCRYCQKAITQQELDDGEIDRLSEDPEDVVHHWCVVQDREWKERGGR
jgi:hypothetical protein